MVEYTLQTSDENPFNGIDVGTHSTPTFADIDGDGDFDLVVGKNNGELVYHVNDGSGGYTEAADNPFADIDVGTRSAPTFADINGNGNLDLIIGEQNGNLNYYVNDGSGGYTAATGSDNPFNGIDVGTRSTPTFADINGDGNLDLIIGEQNGNLNYYVNDGSGGYTEATGDDNPFADINVGNRSAPTFADVDGDGDLDLIVGGNNGQLNYFRNDGSEGYTETTGSDNPFNGIDVGANSAPTFADADGDGDLDLLVGEEDGVLNYYENSQIEITSFHDNNDDLVDRREFRYEGELVRTEAYSYDTDGRLERTEFDGAEATETEAAILADGTVDRIEVRNPDAEDAEGNPVVTVSHYVGDTVTEFASQIDTYDSLGRLITIESDWTSNGTINNIQYLTYVGDTDEIESRDTHFRGSDGIVDKIETETFAPGITDANTGAVTELVVTKYESDGSGGITEKSKITTTYDGQGRLETITYDWNANGNPGQIDTLTYVDATTDVIASREIQYFDGNTNVDRIETEFFAAGTTDADTGTLVKLVKEHHDDNVEGADRITTFTYDDEGRLKTITFDTDANDVPNRMDTLIYVDATTDVIASREIQNFDVNGNLKNIVTETFEDGTTDHVTGTVTAREKAFYADDGTTVVSINFDVNGDGTLDSKQLLEYGADGTTIVREVTNSYEGIDESTGVLLYERLIEEYSPSSADPTQTYLNHRETISYGNEAGKAFLKNIEEDSSLGVPLQSVIETFAEGSATPERVETSTYEDGVLLKSVVETFADEASYPDQPERVETSTYEDGVLLKSVVEIDTNGDGSRVISEQSEYEGGYLISKMMVTENTLFPDGDPLYFGNGDPKATITEKYDLDGNVTQTIKVTALTYFNNNVLTTMTEFYNGAANPENLTERWVSTYNFEDHDGFVSTAPVLTEIITNIFDGPDDSDLVKTTTSSYVDGILDSTETVQRFSDSENNAHTKTEFDDTADGFIDRVEDQIEDAVGNFRQITEYRYDDNGDGTADRTETEFSNTVTIYDENGDIIDEVDVFTRREFDDDGDGAADRSETYDYDPNDGHLIQTTTKFWIHTTSIDSEDTPTLVSVVDRIETRVYSEVPAGDDGAGNLVETISYFTGDNLEVTTDNGVTTITDGGATVSPDRTETHTYDAEGRVVKTVFDGAEATETEDAILADGTPNRSEVYDYYDDDSLKKIAFDDDGDGATTRTEAYTYDDFGRLETTAFDDDFASNEGMDRIETRVYSEVPAGDEGAGNQVETVSYFTGDNLEVTTDNGVTTITDGDATVSPVRTETHTYDGVTAADSRVIHTEFVDGTVTRTETHTYDDFGRLFKTAFDGTEDISADGTVDWIETYTEEGNLSAVRINLPDNDPATDQYTTHFYNAAGRINKREEVVQHYDDDGFVVRIEKRTFTETESDGTGGTEINRVIDVISKGADGVSDLSVAYTYDMDDVLQSVNRRWDYDGDGRIDKSKTVTFEDGAKVSVITRFNDDDQGANDRFAEKLFGANGVLERNTIWNESPGPGILVQPTGQWIYENGIKVEGYNARVVAEGEPNEGRVTSGIRNTFDAEGRIIKVTNETYTYDDENGGTGPGFLARTEFDDNADGIVDRHTVHTFEYGDVEGELVETVKYYNGDVTNTENYDYTEVLHYHATGGVLLRSRVQTSQIDFIDNADGSVDRRETYTYDSYDRLIETAFDDDFAINEGTDRTETYIRDDFGRIERTEFDDNNDTVVDRIHFHNAEDGSVLRSEAYSRDTDGRITETAFDEDGDGLVDLSEFYAEDGSIVRTETYSYDTAGRLERTEFDDNYDTNVDRAEAYTYHANGALATTAYDGAEASTGLGVILADGSVDRREFFNDDGDNVADRIETYSYDTDGRLNLTEFDDNADNYMDRSETYSYDTDGRLERTEFDDNYDKDVDRTETYSYNTDGRLERTEFDGSEAIGADPAIIADDNVDRSETYSYDTDGRLERTEFDDNYDTNVDRIHFHNVEDGSVLRSEAYSRNIDGRITETAYDDDADGSVDRREFFNDDNDQKADQTEAYTYHANGALATIAYDDNGIGDRVDRREFFNDDGDDVADRIETYSYDTDGRLNLTKFDDNYDTNVDRIETRVYSAVSVGADGAGNLIETVSYFTGNDLEVTTNNGVTTITDGGAEVSRVRTETHTYDGETSADSHVIHTEFDDDYDTNVDRSETYFYDTDGRLERTEFDDDYDTNVDRTETYSYSADGDLVSTDFYDANGQNVVDDKVDRRETDTDGDNIADQTLTFEYGGNDLSGLEFVKIREEGNDKVLIQGTDSIGVDSSTGDLVLGPDGNLDFLVFANTDAFEFRLTETDAQGAQGIATINLSEVPVDINDPTVGTGASTLILSDDIYSIIANEDANHVLTINGDDNDTVELTGDWAEDTSDGDSSYLEYKNDDGYTVSIRADVSVIITDDPFAL